MERTIPITVLAMLFTGKRSQKIGWGFLFFGMFFVWFMGSHPDFSYIIFLGPTKIAKGTVLSSEATRYVLFSEGNVSGNIGRKTIKRRVSVINYKFKYPDGVEGEGFSFSERGHASKGQEMEVEYLPYFRTFSRIKGTRRAVHPLGLALVSWLFPVIGLLIILKTLGFGFKARRLLRVGRITEASLTHHRDSGFSSGKMKRYEYTFEFLNHEGNTNEVKQRMMHVEPLKKGTKIDVLFNPERTGEAIMLDSLPGSSKINADSVEPVPVKSIIRFIILPILTLSIHGTYSVIEYVFR